MSLSSPSTFMPVRGQISCVSWQIEKEDVQMQDQGLVRSAKLRWAIIAFLGYSSAYHLVFWVAYS